MTEGLGNFLEVQWGLKGVSVLYDRPPSFFRPLPLPERHELLLRLRDTFLKGTMPAGFFTASDFAGTSPFIEAEGANVEERPGRPLLAISSTSWTPDEDFGYLLDAVVEYDRVASSREADRRVPGPLTGLTWRCRTLDVRCLQERTTAASTAAGGGDGTGARAAAVSGQDVPAGSQVCRVLPGLARGEEAPGGFFLPSGRL